MTELKPSRLYFEQRYGDNSGVEFAVRYYGVDNRIEFDSLGEVSFPIEELDWLIACLTRIREEIS